MRPLWTSPVLERSQKIAQMVLMWLVPGSYLAVRQAIAPGREPAPEDATRSVIDRSLDWPRGAIPPAGHHAHVFDAPDAYADPTAHADSGGDHGGHH
jgi:hypothetical protein